MGTEGLFIFAWKSLFSCIYIQSSVMAGYILHVSCHAGYMFLVHIFQFLQDTCPTYPAMPDTCLSGLLSATFHVSGIDGYLSSVSSHAGYNPFVHIFSRVFPSLS